LRNQTARLPIDFCVSSRRDSVPRIKINEEMFGSLIKSFYLYIRIKTYINEKNNLPHSIDG